MPATPNVVFIIADHHRADYLGCAGADFIHTPNLDRLAARGTLVDGMYTNAPLCVPARIALTSGRYPMNTGCFTNRHPVDPSIPTFLHRLQQAHVTTAMIGKYHHHVHVLDADFAGHEPDIHQLGFDEVHETSGKMGAGDVYCECQYARFMRRQGLLEAWRERTGRFGQWQGTAAKSDPWPWDESTTQDAYIATTACDYLRRVRKDRPFYLHVGFVNPHDPYDAPPRFRQLYDGVEPPPPMGRESRSNPDWWKAYAACISEVDARVGQVLDTLDEQGLTDNTLIIYTADHGDCAGDHGRYGKINFYEPSVHVPLIAAGPNIPAGRHVRALAELLDIGKTVCDVMGCESHLFDQGKSLLPLFSGQTDTHRADVYTEMGSDKMLFDGRYKLMYGDSTHDTRQQYREAPYNGPAFGRPVNLPPDQISLFDLQEDPHEEQNLADNPAYAPLLATIKEHLLHRIIGNMQSVPDDTGSVL